jgi:hypothetical protein
MSALSGLFYDRAGLTGLGFITIIATILIGGAWSALWIAEARCTSRAEMMRTSHQWSILTGCMINHDGQWVPLRNYRKIS